MKRFLMLIALICSFMFSKSQTYHWRVHKAIYCTLDESGDKYTPFKTDTITRSLVDINLDKERLSIHTDEGTYSYRLISYRPVTVKDGVKKSPDYLQMAIKAVDTEGNDLKINFQMGKDNEYKGYDGLLEVIYSKSVRIFYLIKDRD